MPQVKKGTAAHSVSLSNRFLSFIPLSTLVLFKVLHCKSPLSPSLSFSLFFTFIPFPCSFTCPVQEFFFYLLFLPSLSSFSFSLMFPQFFFFSEIIFPFVLLYISLPLPFPSIILAFPFSLSHPSVFFLSPFPQLMGPKLCFLLPLCTNSPLSPFLLEQ